MHPCALAIISLYRGEPRVHVVHVGNNNTDLDDALLFVVCAKDILRELFGDDLTTALPGEVQPGKYTTMHASNMRIDIFTATETQTHGWIGGPTVTISRAHVGHITGVRCDARGLDDLHTQVRELSSAVARINAAADNSMNILQQRIVASDKIASDQANTITQLQDELAALREQLATRTADHLRLVRETVALRAADTLNTDTIIQLNNEVGKLRAISRPVTRFNYDAGVNCVVDNDGRDLSASVPISKQIKPQMSRQGHPQQERAAIPDASYDACIDQIRTFSLGNLRTRAQRDAVIQLQKK